MSNDFEQGPDLDPQVGEEIMQGFRVEVADRRHPTAIENGKEEAKELQQAYDMSNLTKLRELAEDPNQAVAIAASEMLVRNGLSVEKPSDDGTILEEVLSLIRTAQTGAARA